MTGSKKEHSEIPHTELRSRIINPSVSPLKKYQAFVTGTPSILFLLQYEIITGLLGLLPGVVGLVGRKVAYPFLLKKMGKNVVFGRNVTIRHPKKIVIGDNVIIDDNCVLDAKGENNRGITIGDNVFISRNSILSCKEGDITLGTNTNIGTNCLIHSETTLTIGSHVLLAAYCYAVAGGTHDFSQTDKPIISQPSISKGGVRIEDDVWLGAGVTVLDGVAIENGTIVGAGAVVSKSLPAYSIAQGIPAKVVKKR